MDGNNSLKIKLGNWKGYNPMRCALIDDVADHFVNSDKNKYRAGHN